MRGELTAICAANSPRVPTGLDDWGVDRGGHDLLTQPQRRQNAMRLAESGYRSYRAIAEAILSWALCAAEMLTLFIRIEKAIGLPPTWQ